MNIYLTVVGSIKESFYREAVAEFQKRLSRYCHLKILEVKDEKTPDKALGEREEMIRRAEGMRLLSKIPERAYMVALAIEGKTYSSEGLADLMERLELRSQGNLYFIIGGSLGLSKEVLLRANETISFSALTFPHQLMRVIFLEQLYRSYRIRNKEPYHK